MAGLNIVMKKQYTLLWLESLDFSFFNNCWLYILSRLASTFQVFFSGYNLSVLGSYFECEGVKCTFARMRLYTRLHHTWENTWAIGNRSHLKAMCYCSKILMNGQIKKNAQNFKVVKKLLSTICICLVTGDHQPNKEPCQSPYRQTRLAASTQICAVSPLEG